MNNNTNAITAARQAHSSRCRQRVLTVLKQAADLGAEISISSVARHAGVDRSFLYRHRTCMRRCWLRPPNHLPLTPEDRLPVAHPFLPTSLTPTTASPVWLARTPSSASVCPSTSASKPGESPASAHPRTSTTYSGASPSWNKTPQSNAVSSQTATTNSTRREPPTAKSWPNSTVPTRTGAVTRPHLLPTLESLPTTLDLRKRDRLTATVASDPQRTKEVRHRSCSA